MTAKVLFAGKTHTTNGRDGAARSSDGFLDIKLPQPHPARSMPKSTLTSMAARFFSSPPQRELGRP
jgi:organic hydroperoxide reductase OsmC/OhrA